MFSTFYKIVSRSVIACVVLGVVAVVILIAALSRGPVSLTFMGPYLDQIMKDQYPELAVEFADLDMNWDGRDKNLVFGVKNVSVREGLETVAFIPAVTVTFSGDALLKGRLAPSGLEFTGLKIVLNRNSDGQVQLGYSYNQDSDQKKAENVLSATDPHLIHELLRQMGEKQASSDLTAYLERMEIYQFGLFVADERINKTWRVTSADLVVWKNETGLQGRLQGDAHFGDDTIRLVFDAAYNSSTRQTVMQTSIQDLPLPLLAREIPDLKQLRGITLPVSGNIDVSIDSEFQPQKVSFNLQAHEGQVDLPDLYKKPLYINSVEVQGYTEAPFDGVNLNKVKVVSPGPDIQMTGAFRQTEEGFGMSIEGTMPEVLVKDLADYWPYSTAVDAYNWVTRKISKGAARNVTFRVDLPVGAIETGQIPKDAIELAFDIDGASADYFAPLPKVENITGKAVLTEKQIHIFDLAGEVYGLAVPTADVLIYDFDKEDQIADITLTVSGESRKIFEFLDHAPLGLAKPYGIVASNMTGSGKVDAQFVFPLLDDLQLSQVDYEANGAFENAFIPNVYEDLDLANGNLAVLVTPANLQVKGNATINGNATDVSFQSWFTGQKKGDRRYEVIAKLDDEARRELKLLDTEYLKGPVGASLAVDVHENGNSDGVVTLNLLEAELSVPEIKLLKPVGVRGLFGTQFQHLKSGFTELSNIRLNSEQIDLVGQATLDPTGLRDFKSSRFRFDQNEVTLEIKRVAENQYDVRLGGERIDLRPHILEEQKPLTEEELTAKTDEPLEVGPTVHASFAFKEALLDEGIVTTDLNGALIFSGGLIQKADISSKLEGKSDIRYIIAPRPQGGRRADFWADDAGYLLKALDIYDNAQGGKLQLAANLTNHRQAPEMKGQVKIENMKIYKAPVLGKILTIGSLTGIVELLQNDGMTFATIEGPFTFRNGLLETEDFRAVGAIGLTYTGQIDMNKDVTNGFGTVIPSYTLNSILGNIPILGRLLVGREGEGIFGFSYKISGSNEEPDIAVNPVSALAPGILRRMFFEPWGDPKDGDVSIDAGKPINGNNTENRP
ncbi:AsmA-like C-terminal region-containing protein [Sneathiella limimaris]|uniref:YhdP family protein n=1 Tax=Sneathiella limimaris TaxID=1964213 RepID=UPI00146AB320|nr:AsmA-like C-terminal region-containing protein [Sneathiella limimaris]